MRKAPAQLEINLRHGDPVELADQVFMFKRTIREAALKHDIYATFMAKPIQGQPGSAMHIHQSVVDKKTGSNIFTDEDGAETDAFFHFIGGMQKHVPNALVMFAPYVNSYRRLTPGGLGAGQHQMGLRQPHHGLPRAALGSGGAARRKPHPVLRRQSLSGACGLAGLRPDRHQEQDQARRAGRHHRQRGRDRPAARPAGGRRPVRGGRRAARRCSAVRSSSTYAAIKRAEFETFMEVISPWEREFLLLNV